MARQEEDQSKKAIRDRLRASLAPSREALRANLRAQAPQQAPAVPPEPVQGLESPPAKTEGLGFRPGEMLSNVPSSFIKQAKAVLWDLPKAAAESLIHYAKNPNQYLSDLKITPKYLPDIARIIKDDYSSYYDPDSLGSNITEDPMRPVADFAGLASIAGGGLATTGKLAAGAVKASSRSLARGAIQVGKVGRNVSKLEVLDPSSLVIRGISSGVAKPLADAIGVGRYTNKLKMMDAALGGEADAEAYTIAERIYGGKLTPQEHDVIIESFAVGNKEKNAALATQRPDLWAKRAKMREWLQEDEAYYLEQDKVVDPTTARDAKAKGWLRYKQQKGEKAVTPEGLPRELTLDDAFTAMKTGDEPVFFRLFSNKADRELFDAFIERQYHGGTLSRAEKRAMRGEVPTDINQILSHQLRTSIGTKKNIKLARAAQEMLSQDGQLKVVTSKTTRQEIKALREAGYAPFQGPFYQKYHETLGKAVNMIADAAKRPGNKIQQVAEAAERAKDVLLRAEEATEVPPIELWAPKHAVNWLNLRLNPSDSMIGSVIRWGLNLGGTLPYYKAIATVMNPRYWIANAVGDAALAFLYGVHPQALKYAHKLRGMVPDEIRNIGLNKLYQSDYGLFMRTANRFQNYAQNVDNYFKRAVFINEAVREGVKAKLLTVGRDFFVAEDQLIPFIANLKAAPNRWINNLEDITKLKEKLSATAMSRVATDKQRATLGKRYARSANKDVAPCKRADDAVYSGDRPSPEIYPDMKPSRPGKIEQTAPDEIYGPGGAATSPEAVDPKIRYNELKAKPKAIIADNAPGNDASRAQAIDSMVQELAQLGRDIKKAAKPIAETGDIARVTPFSEDYALAAPGARPDAGQYGYSAGEAKPLTSAQERIRLISRQLDDNQLAQDQAFADMVWQIIETDKLESVAPALAREAMMADRAIDITGKFFASYSRLHPWEKKVIRQFIPFYTFTKAMTQLAFRLPFMMPKKQFVYLNLWRMWNDIIDHDEPNNSFFRSVVPVMALPDGDIVFVKVNNINPFGSVRTIGVAGVEVPSAFDIFGNHPIFRLTMGARGQATPRPLRPGEMGTRLDNGEVWTYTGRDFKRTLLQPSWAKSLWSLFPQGQLLDTLLPGAQEEGGFLLNPRTIRGPDGQPLYPIGWPERLISAIVPAARINPSKMMQRDLAKLQQIKRSYMKELRRSSPEKRQVIMTILREMSQDIRKNYLEY